MRRFGLLACVIAVSLGAAALLSKKPADPKDKEPPTLPADLLSAVKPSSWDR